MKYKDHCVLCLLSRNNGYHVNLPMQILRSQNRRTPGTWKTAFELVFIKKFRSLYSREKTLYYL